MSGFCCDVAGESRLFDTLHPPSPAPSDSSSPPTRDLHTPWLSKSQSSASNGASANDATSTSAAATSGTKAQKVSFVVASHGNCIRALTFEISASPWCGRRWLRGADAGADEVCVVCLCVVCVRARARAHVYFSISLPRSLAPARSLSHRLYSLSLSLSFSLVLSRSLSLSCEVYA